MLRRCENSTLILKADAVRSPTRERLQAEFQQLGIGAERITWLDWSATREEHLACYRMVDIALDTFPYNGATTTCEALWMGVPVVSLSGKVPASRMGRSILRAAGLEEWVTDEASRFVELACELARNFRSVRQERGALRGLVSASALCAESRYCSEFSQLLRGALAAVN